MDGKGFLFVAGDRTSKLVLARIDRKATKLAATSFLKVLVHWRFGPRFSLNLEPNFQWIRSSRNAICSRKDN